MNRNEYIDSIKEKLKGLPEADIAKAVEYYEEAIDDRLEDGLTVEQAINSIGTPDEIAEKILMEFPITKLVAAKTKPNRALKVWEIILLIVGSPLWITVAALLFVAALLVVIFFFVAIVVVVVCLLAVLISGLAGVVACFVELFRSGGLNFWVMGASLICLGLGVFLLIPTKNFIVWLFEQIGRFFKWIKRKIVRK